MLDSLARAALFPRKQRSTLAPSDNADFKEKIVCLSPGVEPNMQAASQVYRAATLIALGVVATLPNPTHAAVAACKALYVGEEAENSSELLAKKRALESWSKGAQLHGEQFTRWGIAWNRRLDCTRTAAGTFRCQAAGHPCTIQQVPSENLIPFKRRT